MPSPIAHFAVAAVPALVAGAGSALRTPRCLLVVAVASVLPDADLLLVMALPGGIAWHHGPTHSLLGAVALALALGALGGLRGKALLAAAFAGFTHTLLDALVGEPGGSAAFGVPLFWPASPARFVSPAPLFMPYRIDEPGFLANMVSPGAVAPYLREIGLSAMLVGMAALGGWIGERGRSGSAAG